MRKSGLHKQISSIFDGVPIPKNEAVPEDANDTSEPMTQNTQDAPEIQPQQEALCEPQSSKDSRPSLAKRMSADPSACASAPSIQVDRPMPQPKSIKPAVKSGPGFYSHFRKHLLGSDTGELDARQKKMVTLVGILSVVLAVVMYISLGGVGKSQAVAAEEDGKAISPINSSVKAAENWTLPEPLPEDLRDATSPIIRHSNSQSSDVVDTANSELIVKGILFSKTNPSAIINDKILCKGDTINGSKLVNITRDTVEFEAKGHRWTQKVQR